MAQALDVAHEDMPVQAYNNRLAVAEQDPDVQAKLCMPEENPDAAAYFITSFCKTMDEDDGGAIKPIPNKRFVLRMVRCFDFRDEEAPWVQLGMANIHLEKSRRMIATWIACAYNLWSLMYVRGYSAKLISNGEDMVDDGGTNSTVDSMFGRMRFMHDHLPPHVWRAVSFAYMRAKRVDGDEFVVGEAPTTKAARGGGYTRIWIDEHAFLVNAHAIHAAADPACKFGKVYMCTVNGEDNLFAELKLKRPAGWRFHETDWHDDPDKTEGLRPTVTEAERDRYGLDVSTWLETVTASLSNETIAQEYNRRYDKPTLSTVYREFDRAIHVAKYPVEIDPRLPLILGVDYASTGVGAAVLCQPVSDWELRAIWDYELSGAGGATIHAREIWEGEHGLLRFGVDVPIVQVQLIGGPDTDIIQTGSGQSIAGYFREYGFTNIRQCRVRGDGSIGRRIEVVRRGLFLKRIIISPTCRTLIKRFPQYKWPVNKATGHIGGREPVKGPANHIMDAFGYACCEVFPYENASLPMDAINNPIPNAPGARLIDPDLDRHRMLPWEREEQSTGTVWDMHRRDIV